MGRAAGPDFFGPRAGHVDLNRNIRGGGGRSHEGGDEAGTCAPPAHDGRASRPVPPVDDSVKVAEGGGKGCESRAEKGGKNDREGGVSDTHGDAGKAGPAGDGYGEATAPECEAAADLRQDGADDGQAAWGAVAGKDDGVDEVDVGEAAGKLPDSGGGKRGNGGDPGKSREVSGAGEGVEGGDALREGGIVGEVEAMGAAGQGGAGEAIGVATVGLEGSGGIDDDCRGKGRQSRLKVGSVAVERCGLAAVFGAVAGGDGGVTACDEDLEAPVTGQRHRDSGPESAVTAEDEDGGGQSGGLLAGVIAAVNEIWLCAAQS
jgi:hypothetical protein